MAVIVDVIVYLSQSGWSRLRKIEISRKTVLVASLVCLVLFLLIGTYLTFGGPGLPSQEEVQAQLSATGEETARTEHAVAAELAAQAPRPRATRGSTAR
jgi:hypothetical protein